MSKYYLSLIETKKLCKYAKTKFQICVENYVFQCGIFSILLCPWHLISQWQFEGLNFFQLLKTEIHQSFFWPISVHNWNRMDAFWDNPVYTLLSTEISTWMEPEALYEKFYNIVLFTTSNAHIWPNFFFFQCMG